MTMTKAILKDIQLLADAYPARKRVMDALRSLPDTDPVIKKIVAQDRTFMRKLRNWPGDVTVPRLISLLGILSGDEVFPAELHKKFQHMKWSLQQLTCISGVLTKNNTLYDEEREHFKKQSDKMRTWRREANKLVKEYQAAKAANDSNLAHKILSEMEPKVKWLKKIDKEIWLYRH